MSRSLFSNTFKATKSYSRSIWTGLTATGPCIEECVQVAKSGIREKPEICVALLSKSFSPHHYQKFLSQVQEQINPKILLGGIVDRVPEVGHGISFWVAHDEAIVPFTVEDSKDRLKVRSISVGRWGRAEETSRLKYQSDHVDKMGWKDFGSISKPAQPFELPAGLSKDATPSFFFMVSDNEPDQLLQTLDHHFPHTPKIGIIGSSTPFITGTPYTLFNSELLGSGVVGFAALNSPTKAAIRVDHAALEKIGEPLKITRCRGNVILDLDQAGATGLLLKLIHQDRKASKDEEFYLAVYPTDAQGQEEKMTVSRITSGDPSRGNMSIDTTADLQVGQTVQFLRRKPFDKRLNILSNTDSNEILLSVGDKDHTIDMSPVQIPEKTTLVEDTFGGMSENGIIVGRSSLATQVLDVPYSNLTFKLST
ncbi:hypothetical protein G6F62_001653 [Rhizopus arrhizus]|nr:hypothetical protein G6F23_004249 [Rhizopus arrhizus]KAG0764289.1 hypothetical protein G6F24_005334 [Rhizopus arrhizus]KAG0790796.1 hypothetical protein G6F21_005546 [Rhizopus arrhizus]KAG0799683.1 hypothetical protein G6F22_002983 [Rhizopus arrhizus]KAG0812236.1 hypothetical protein G6F20_006525 [Rhizopus arrhizus]